MADIAKIGFEADTDQLRRAKDDLEALAPAAGKVEKASTSLSSRSCQFDRYCQISTGRFGYWNACRFFPFRSGFRLVQYRTKN